MLACVYGCCMLVAVAAVQYTAVHSLTYAHCMKGHGLHGLDAVVTRCRVLIVWFGGCQLQCMAVLLLGSGQSAAARRVLWCLHLEQLIKALRA